MPDLLQLADTITRLEFYVGGYGGPAFRLKLTPDSCEVQAWGVDDLPPDRITELQHTPTRFKRLVRRLFRHYGVAAWQARYEEPDTLDGTQWELSLYRSEEQPCLACSGCNAYPPHYRRLLRLLKPYFHAHASPGIAASASKAVKRGG